MDGQAGHFLQMLLLGPDANAWLSLALMGTTCSAADMLPRPAPARPPQRVWWPAEAFDPFALPKAGAITPAMVAALEEGERYSCVPPQAWPGGVPEERREQHAAAAAAHQEDPERKVVVLLFGATRPFYWAPASSLLGFEEHLKDKTGAWWWWVGGWGGAELLLVLQVGLLMLLRPNHP
jgi:hypothetical protein